MAVSIPAMPLTLPLPHVSQLPNCHSCNVLALKVLTLLLDMLNFINNPLVLPSPPLLVPFRQHQAPLLTLGTPLLPLYPIETALNPQFPHLLGTDTLSH